MVAFPSLLSNHFRSIPSCLGRREISGPSARKELEKAIEDQVIRNIAEDRFSSQEIKICSSSPDIGRSIARSHDLVAVREGTSTSLWNILLGLRLWKCSPPQASPRLSSRPFQYQETLVDRSGVVIHVYESNLDNSKYVEIFFDGKKTGSLVFQNYMTCFRLINGHIFTVGVDPNTEPFSREKLNLYEWDIRGYFVRKFSLAALKENEIWKKEAFVGNEDYFILCVGTSFVRSSTSSKIFVFDFKTGLSRVFDLEASSDDLEIGSIFLRGNHLIIGSNKVRRSNPARTIDSKIIVFNLLTGKIERTYPIEPSEGEISHLVADKTQAIFLKWRGYGELCSIDLSDGNQKKLLELPCFDDRNGRLQLSLMGKFLIVCYPTGYWNSGTARQIKSIVDLNTRRETRQIRYKRYLWENMSLESGILVVPNVYHEGKLYVENFYPYDTEKCDTFLREV